ncbi:TniQ family protein [Guptibacillus hwajinpoensis]|uniref:TniQ family protein n=1 Tax=Guptibacillus hwajinpoensis TaxID=208199 RepID=UPI0024B38331|nr:TniQ family protein [Pseudalkalibacillus hwajinpoensis]
MTKYNSENGDKYNVILTDFENEEISFPVTKFYNLQPKFIRGKDVECLSSYLIRLATIHNVATSELINEIVNPEYKYTQLKRPHINGYGQITKDVLLLVKMNCGLSKIDNLSMINYQNVFSKVNMFKNYKAWCVSCLNEMKINDGIVYGKLIWTLNGYDYCQNHSNELETQCRNCGKQQNIISNNDKSGYCQYCHVWLARATEEPLVEDHEKKYYSTQIENMIEFFNSKGCVVNRDDVKQSFLAIRNHYNKTTLMELLEYKLTFNLLTSFSYNKLPSLNVMLYISYKLKIPLINLLTNDGIELPSRHEKSIVSFSDSYIERYLLEVLNKNIYKGRENIAAKLRMSKKTLIKKYPELMKKIDKNNQEFKKSSNNNSIHFDKERDHTRVSEYLIQCINSTEVTPIRKISIDLNINTTTIRERFPKLYSLIKEKNKLITDNKNLEFEIMNKVEYARYSTHRVDKNIEERLYEILSTISNTPKPLKEIATEIGITYRKMEHNYKEILDLIKIKNSEAREIKRERLFKRRKLLIQNAVDELNEIGKYPSFAAVESKVHFCISSPKLSAFYIQYLQQLGIRRENFRGNK